MNVSTIDSRAKRQTEAPVAAMFPARWSPRAFSGDPVAQEQIATLIEAARWAPSCYNEQPWRFAVTYAGTGAFDALFGTLVEANQAWAGKAGALVAVASRTRFERNDKPSPTHSFDTGAAWMSMALQASELGLVTHGMQGFDADAARDVLSLPSLFELPALIAVGHPGDIEDLPEDYRERETPSPRKPLGDILFADNFEDLAS